MHDIIQPDCDTTGLWHGRFKPTTAEQAATLHFGAHDDTAGLGAKAELLARRAAREAGVSRDVQQPLGSLPDLR